MPAIVCDVPFDLRLALHGHGWVSLEPHRWDEEARVFTTVLQTAPGPVDVTLKEGARGLVFRTSAPHGRADREVRAKLWRMLRLDEDLVPFWALCRAEPRLRWVARRRAGRLLRSATLFEDLMKLLFTTNCSWAATQRMCARLVSGLGERAPSGRRAFPGPEPCAAAGERFFRDEVRAGYRARHAVSLASAFAEGRLEEARLDDPTLSTREVRSRLVALPGFGPYAAGQALRLLGRYEDLALDSWCRTKLAELEGRARPRRDADIERSYARFGAYRGLVLWMDLTADWHRASRRPDVA